MENDDYKEVLRRLSNLETHIINLIIPIQNISKVLTSSADIHFLLDLLQKPLKIDDTRLANRLKEFQEMMVKFELKVDEFDGKTETIDIVKTLGEIKYIGKKLKEIEEKIGLIQEKGIRKQVELNFSCDGYDLVKKTSTYDKAEELPQKDLLKYALESLDSKESYVLVHRLGLDGEKEKTFAKIAMQMKIGASSISIIYQRALRKLRHPSRIEKVRGCNNKKLQLAVLGE